MIRRTVGSRPRRRGAAAVEVALVAPIFIALLLGMIEASRMGMAAQLLSTAAREGCRVAVLEGRTEAHVRQRVDGVLAGSGIRLRSSGGFQLSSGWLAAKHGNPITLSLAADYDDISWLPLPRFLKGRTLRAAATLNSERP